MRKRKLKVVLVDNEARALNRLKLVLLNFKYVEVIGQFLDSKEGLLFILNNQPDLAFVDIEMPELNGINLLTELNKTTSHTKVIFVTAFDQYAIEAIRKRAFDYLKKPIHIDDLEAALDRIQLRELSELTVREIEVLRLLGDGLKSEAIGEKLYISRHTVDTYRRSILRKTGAKNTAELVSMFSKNQMI